MSDLFWQQPPLSSASSQCELGAGAQTNPPSMRCKQVISMPGGKNAGAFALLPSWGFSFGVGGQLGGCGRGVDLRDVGEDGEHDHTAGGQTALLLANGQVLVMGGSSSSGALGSAELYIRHCPATAAKSRRFVDNNPALFRASG